MAHPGGPPAVAAFGLTAADEAGPDVGAATDEDAEFAAAPLDADDPDEP